MCLGRLQTTPPASGKLPQEMPIMMLQPASRIPIDEAVSEGAAYAVMELTQQSISLMP